LDAAPDLLCTRAAENLRAYSEERLEVHVIMVDFDTLDPAGASPGALDLTTWGAA
jgi:cobalt-precorrin-5B (C1)-methyltransferase